MSKTATLKSIDKAVTLKGTQYDRKRKLTDKEVLKIKKSLSSGRKTVAQLAEKYDVTPFTIKYNTDPEFRQHAISVRSGKAYGTVTCDFQNRVEYKERLLGSKKYQKYVEANK